MIAIIVGSDAADIVGFMFVRRETSVSFRIMNKCK